MKTKQHLLAANRRLVEQNEHLIFRNHQMLAIVDLVRNSSEDTVSLSGLREQCRPYLDAISRAEYSFPAAPAA